MQTEEEDEPLFAAPQSAPTRASPPPVPVRKPANGSHKQTPARALPAAVVRPTGPDPFQEAPEPRLPPGAEPEEKLKSFRLIIQQKDAALARGRALYSAIESEARALRNVAAQLNADLAVKAASHATNGEHAEQLARLSELLEQDTIRADLAEKKNAALQSKLTHAERERADLSNALAEVEAQNRELSLRLEDERKTREQLADELISAKESLGQAQSQLQQSTGTSDKLLESRAQNQTLKAALEESEKARSNLVEALDETTEQLNQTTARLSTIESESEWSKGTLEQVQERNAELEKTLEHTQREWRETESHLSQLEVRFEATAAEAKRDKTALVELEAQLEAVRAENQRLEAAQKSFEEDVVSLSDQLHSAQKDVVRVAETESKLEAAQIALELAQSRVVHLESVQHKSAQLATESASLAHQLDGLRSQLSTLQNDNETLRLKLLEADTLLSEHQGAAEASTRAIDDAERRSAELEAAINALTVQKEQEAQNKQQRIEALEKQAQQAFARAAAAESQRQQLDEALATARESGSRVDVRVKELQEKLATADARSRQQESRAVLAESRAKEALARAANFATAESRAKIAESRVAELTAKLDNVTSTLSENESSLLSLQAQEVELKSALEAFKSSSSIQAAPSSDELDVLRRDNANLKKKLALAENAIEAAASLKAKVARLEAQLKLKG
jgi:chromosome segregation ATPase